MEHHYSDQIITITVSVTSCFIANQSIISEVNFRAIVATTTAVLSEKRNENDWENNRMSANDIGYLHYIATYTS